MVDGPGDTGWVHVALPAALLQLARFDLSLRSDVHVTVHLDASALHRATGRSEPWLRAYTRAATVDVVDPALWRARTWPLPLERLTHELCHAAVLQRFASDEALRAARLPPWLSEGAASVVACQGLRRMPIDVVTARAAGSNPLDPSWLERDHEVAYAAAHWAVALLVARTGPQIIVDLVDASRRVPLEQALHDAAGFDRATLWSATRAAATELPSDDALSTHAQ